MSVSKIALQSMVCLIMQVAKHCEVIEGKGGRRVIHHIEEHELMEWLLGEIDRFGKELTKGVDGDTKRIICNEIKNELQEGSYLVNERYKEKLLAFIEYIMYRPNRNVMELIWQCIKQAENNQIKDLENQVLNKEEDSIMNIKAGSVVVTKSNQGFIVVEDDGFYRVMNSDFTLWEETYHTIEEVQSAIKAYYDIAKVIPSNLVRMSYSIPDKVVDIKSFE
ncbi:hypothetical protein AM501_24080 [Aneurinibacillus migulanus]|uniref:hypothetical protein n=1 Tax=Aneurinibacillus migulanus TaxID=47500 RepID=UPI0005B9F375|nr:hypothetical protein [Aneurinibacillus migulanus]KIV58912.1 hypothetical protein TS64_03900 [Aneurinibacillus migulanus]KPD05856.1 hypothetical protein AM501_24080 [Aneurinibacillus migulanus]